MLERVGETESPLDLGRLECGERVRLRLRLIVSNERLCGAADDPLEDRRQLLVQSLRVRLSRGRRQARSIPPSRPDRAKALRFVARRFTPARGATRAASRTDPHPPPRSSPPGSPGPSPPRSRPPRRAPGCGRRGRRPRRGSSRAGAPPAPTTRPRRGPPPRLPARPSPARGGAHRAADRFLFLP